MVFFFRGGGNDMLIPEKPVKCVSLHKLVMIVFTPSVVCLLDESSLETTAKKIFLILSSSDWNGGSKTTV